MKKLTFILMTAAVSFVGHAVADTLNITQADAVSQVLPLYSGTSGLELVIASNVKRVYATITIDVAPNKQLEKTEAAKLIEKALIEQAGIVITRLDGKRASVTYNDALKTTPVKKTAQK